MRSVRICVLSSGSGGNCLWVEAGATRALIDAGLPLRETKRRCLDAGLRFAVRAGVAVQFPALRITPVALPHDAWEPVAYVFDDGAVRGAIVTDLGCAPPSVVRALQGLDALVLEMNHDVRMLIEGPYPWSLKQRIRGGRGHLSNAQGAALLAQVLHGGLRHLTLAHLSEHNNTPAHARRAAEAVLSRYGSAARLCIGGQSRALDPVLLEPARAVPLRRGRQLALFG